MKDHLFDELNHRGCITFAVRLSLNPFGLITLNNWDFSNKNAHEAGSSTGPHLHVHNHVDPTPSNVDLGVVSGRGSNYLALGDHYLALAASGEDQSNVFLSLGAFNCPSHGSVCPAASVFFEFGFQLCPAS